MATITEDYVSYEVAKLLKEKGFDKDWVDGSIEKFLNGTEGYSLPTLAIAMKWLRLEHNIVVEPFIREDTKYVWYIYRIETKFNKKHLVFCWGSKNIKYKRYEQAVEAALKYTLENLI